MTHQQRRGATAQAGPHLRHSEVVTDSHDAARAAIERRLRGDDAVVLLRHPPRSRHGRKADLQSLHARRRLFGGIAHNHLILQSRHAAVASNGAARVRTTKSGNVEFQPAQVAGRDRDEVSVVHDGDSGAVLLRGVARFGVLVSHSLGVRHGSRARVVRGVSLREQLIPRPGEGATKRFNLGVLRCQAVLDADELLVQSVGRAEQRVLQIGVGADEHVKEDDDALQRHAQRRNGALNLVDDVRRHAEERNQALGRVKQGATPRGPAPTLRQRTRRRAASATGSATHVDPAHAAFRSANIAIVARLALVRFVHDGVDDRTRHRQ
mmetsp:Transcript_17189/g.60359  ORF Transcript_17189/g.60359 Transcript_17189/m.60359 type:complete len:323 (-) Transcript_17189:1008-1976(-)